jgi:hypothetical protein
MKTKDGQNVFDICLQGYGDLERLFDLIVDNDLTLNTVLSSGQDIIVDETLINIQISEFVKVNNLVLINNTNDNDISVSETLAIQWPVYVDLNEEININKRIDA